MSVAAADHSVPCRKMDNSIFFLIPLESVINCGCRWVGDGFSTYPIGDCCFPGSFRLNA